MPESGATASAGSGDFASGPIDVLGRIPRGADGPDRLLRESQRAGIAQVLARADTAVRFPVSGNRQALDACARLGPAVLPIAVVAPLSSAAAAEDLRDLTAAGAVGFWLGSDQWHGHPTAPSAALDGLLSDVARTGRPLFIPIGRWGDSSAIGARTEALGIPVILVGAHYNTIVDDLAAADRFPHLHLETSSLAHYGAIEKVVGVIGSERLLLGTGSPHRGPHGPLNAVAAANIPDGARRAILGGNAARLFGLLTPTIEPAPPVVATAAIDVHAHLPPTPWDVPDMAPTELLDAQELVGIVRVIASSTEAVLGDTAVGNAAVVAACAADDRQLGYLVADPDDLKGTREQLRRWGGAPGIVGVKVHCQWSGRVTASSHIEALFALLADHGRPVKIHVDGDGWEEALLALARRHQALPIIAAHAGPGAPHAGVGRIAAQTDNVYLELASSFAELETVRALVRTIPTGRLLFGTDAPLLDPSFVIGTYVDAGGTPAIDAAVSRETATGLFGLTLETDPPA